jgi:hypothetical protein
MKNRLSLNRANLLPLGGEYKGAFDLFGLFYKHSQLLLLQLRNAVAYDGVKRQLIVNTAPLASVLSVLPMFWRLKPQVL